MGNKEIFHCFLYAIDCDWHIFLLRVTGQNVYLYKCIAKLVPLKEPSLKLSVPRVKIQN